MDTTTERNELEGKLIPELQQIAQGLGIEGSQKLRKAGLIDAIVSRSADDGTSANGPAATATAIMTPGRSGDRPDAATREHGDNDNDDDGDHDNGDGNDDGNDADGRTNGEMNGMSAKFPIISSAIIVHEKRTDLRRHSGSLALAAALAFTLG